GSGSAPRSPGLRGPASGRGRGGGRRSGGRMSFRHDRRLARVLPLRREGRDGLEGHRRMGRAQRNPSYKGGGSRTWLTLRVPDSEYRSMSLFRTKSIEQSIADAVEPGHQLKRSLSAWDLMILGVAVAVGAGIFSVGARAAGDFAGPAVTVAFMLAALACALAIMCYAEFASTIPVAGSAYTYTYATLGEFLAWIIGWDLILELLTA